MSLSLEVDGLTVDRGGRRVLEDVCFTATATIGLKLTGPNGIGKTTLLRTLAGYQPMSAGAIRLLGGDLEKERGEQVHYVGHADALKSALTVRENLEFWSRYLGTGASVDTALYEFRLSPLASIPVVYLSAGQRRRVALARLRVSARPVWLLDEPTVALDEVSQSLLMTACNAHLRGGGLIVAATHQSLAFDQSAELRLGSREVDR
ncbi:MAG: heme ABC exporter ATP-binding protein CcmA [Hyphomicrobiaceae bacterium]